jgi:hypothetical protein
VALAGTLTEGFTSNSGQWTFTGTGCAVSGGFLEITPTSPYSRATSVATYDLRNSVLAVKVAQVANGTTSTDTEVIFGATSGNNAIKFTHEAGTLYCQSYSGTTKTTRGSVAYSATSMLWWRFRHDGTNVYWETSPDGTTWTARATVAATSLPDLSAGFVMLDSGFFSGATSTPHALFDTVNSEPSTSSVTATQPGGWNTAAAVTSSSAATWRVACTVSAVSATAWATRTPVTRTAPARWAAAAAASTARPSAWAVAGRVTSSTSASWAVKQTVTDTAPSAWRAAAAVTAAGPAAWRVAAPVTRSAQAAWNLADPVGRASTTQAAAWATRAAVTSARASQWPVSVAVTASRQAAWSVTRQAVTSAAATWDLRNPVTTAADTAWAVLGGALGECLAEWDVRAPATRAVPAQWSVEAVIPAQADWAIDGFTVRTSDSSARLHVTGAAGTLVVRAGR